LGEAVRDEAFRGDVEELELFAIDFFEDGIVFVRGHGTIEAGGTNAALREAVNLVFHKGNEGAYHGGQAVHCQGGRLEAQ
jgi:hypothetical protein